MELILKKIDELNKFMRVDTNRISILLLITFLYFHVTIAYELYNILFSEFETFELFGFKLLYICYCSTPFLMILYLIIF